MTYAELKQLYDACTVDSDYIKNTFSEKKYVIPSFAQIKKAKKEGRLVARDEGREGYIRTASNNPHEQFYLHYEWLV